MSGVRIAEHAVAARVPGRLGGLWRHPDFLKLWTGETISLFGSQVTALALPLTAILTLRATPQQMGILGAATYAPFLLVTSFAGVWVDRRRRRPVMIAANLGRAISLGLIPLAAFAGLLRIEYLYAVGFLAGSLQVFFELAYQSYVPSLVERAHLVEGNSKLQASASAAQIGGPGLAGLLVELVTAPVAILVDALSFLASALGVALIHKPEPEPIRDGREQHLLREITDGLRFVLGNRCLRAMAGEAATYNLFSTAMETVFLLYVTRVLGIRPGLLGFIITTGSAGSLIGSFVAERAIDRFGFGRAMIGSYLIACVPAVLIPLASGSQLFAASLLIATYFVMGIGLATSQIYVWSLRQAVTPERFLGRMNAGYRFIVTGVSPAGSLLAGFLAGAIGLRPALAIGAIGTALAVSWVIFSPLPALRELPRAGG